MDELTVILNEIRPGRDFSGAQNFFDEGLLDSVDLTTLVSLLESRYGIFVDVEEMVPENFQNSIAIRTLLARKGAKL